ncbi:hypothetical protein PVAP13_3NG300103, partial [Panicum virgatum]
SDGLPPPRPRAWSSQTAGWRAGGERKGQKVETGGKPRQGHCCLLREATRLALGARPPAIKTLAGRASAARSRPRRRRAGSAAEPVRREQRLGVPAPEPAGRGGRAAPPRRAQDRGRLRRQRHEEPAPGPAVAAAAGEGGGLARRGAVRAEGEDAGGGRGAPAPAAERGRPALAPEAAAAGGGAVAGGGGGDAVAPGRGGRGRGLHGEAALEAEGVGALEQQQVPGAAELVRAGRRDLGRRGGVGRDRVEEEEVVEAGPHPPRRAVERRRDGRRERDGGAAERAGGVRAEPDVDAVGVEGVRAQRQRAELVAVRELEQAHGALPGRPRPARRRQVLRRGQRLDGGGVEAAVGREGVVVVVVGGEGREGAVAAAAARGGGGEGAAARSHEQPQPAPAPPPPRRAEHPAHQARVQHHQQRRAHHRQHRDERRAQAPARPPLAARERLRRGTWAGTRRRARGGHERRRVGRRRRMAGVARERRGGRRRGRGRRPAGRAHGGLAAVPACLPVGVSVRRRSVRGRRRLRAHGAAAEAAAS